MAKNKQFIRQKGEPGGFRGKAERLAQQEAEARGEFGGEDDTLVNVVEVQEKAQDFFERNQMMVLGVLTALVLLLGGWLGYKYAYIAPKEKAGLAAMYKAENQFRRDSFALALQNPGAGFEGFLDIIDNYGGTKAANLSKYYAGVSYLNLGKYEAAIEYLKEYSASDDVTPISRDGAVGDCYAELGDLGQAMTWYKKAANSNNDFLTPYYLNKVAMLHIKNGDEAAAKTAFARIKNEFPTSNEATEAAKHVVEG